MRGSGWAWCGIAVAVLAACGGDDETGTTGGTTTSSASTGGGEVPCAQPADPDGGRVACPTSGPGATTALPALAAFRGIAEGVGPTKWLGGVLGQEIARDGTDTGGTLTLWSAGFCIGDAPNGLGDALNVSSNATDCLATRQCEALDCSSSPDYDPPLVDSAAAIATAFPGEPADAKYALSYTAAVGDYWTVTSAMAGMAVKVDARTGAIVE